MILILFVAFFIPWILLGIIGPDAALAGMVGWFVLLYLFTRKEKK